MPKKISSLIFRYKITAVAAITILAIGGYYGYQYFFAPEKAVRYVTATAEKGVLIISVSGSGQVSASNQVDVKSKVSGDAVFVGAKNGQEVKAGILLAQLDARDAQKSVRDAEANLQSAKLSLEKLKQPADAYSILQAENSLISARDNLAKLKLSQETDYQKALEAKKKAEDNIVKAYEDSFNTIANAFLNLPNIITALNDVLYGKTIGQSETAIGRDQNNISALANTVSPDYYASKLAALQTSAENDYKSARAKYDASFENYKNASRYSEKPVIESLLAETLETTKAIAQNAKSESNYLDAWADYRSTNNLTIFSTVKGYQANLATYTGQTNTHLSNLLSVQRSLEDNREALVNTERDLKEMDQNNPLNLAAAEASVKEKSASLEKLKSGPDALDIQSSELSVKQRENALLDAKEKLADYYIRAPFDGMVAEINIKTGDPVSANAVSATLITRSRIAEISLNEVDVAKVKTSQKATLTFDAVPDLSIAGQVAEIAAIGSIAQGVVTYNVKISFDTQDERVKPGMSVSAAIITDVKQDVVIVPNSAVKTSGNPRTERAEQSSYDGNSRYVEILVGDAPQSQSVEVGLSNDTSTEITGGLKEGESVVTQTISATAAQTSSSQSSSGIRIPGLTPGGGTFRR
ncbi:MAG: Efflux transporter, RND family, MFP subunit [Candidatus Adlerbacteria bacterium GW2011_GWC1_50_9]|uniref:Efflux transporter, RND family, MFP subunit n=1 Tax=Candidatus Adlerbacteria bacterium GW2011_GWC1_50_9 TaxID=1618608 RepID=A0A0G1WJ05_9BACT|nr:MAG: Efflux transporter, RND family, MFP subunit [Candidatus Adlerbacteria bacterium GW2011_GWC1_50_9]